jgi:hypothetical protein
MRVGEELEGDCWLGVMVEEEVVVLMVVVWGREWE